MEEFNPVVVVFVCNWCSYGGADQAGANRLSVSSDIRILRVMCSGRVEPEMMVQALHDGADGVMVLGCHPGDCHYKTGNYNTLKRMTLLKEILRGFGVEEERIVLDWVSASEGEKFSRVTGEMVEKIKKLGPLKRNFSEIKLHEGENHD
jgi:F420-non-reducing hydrogenase iron-sulfur subunit